MLTSLLTVLYYLDLIHYDVTGEWTPNVGIARKEWAAVTEEFLRRPNTISQVTTQRTISDRQCADKRIIRNLWRKNTVGFNLSEIHDTEHFIDLNAAPRGRK